MFGKNTWQFSVEEHLTKLPNLYSVDSSGHKKQNSTEKKKAVVAVMSPESCEYMHWMRFFFSLLLLLYF